MRRRLLVALALAGLPLGAPAIAADPWPTRTVRIIVPFPPGGPADGSARVLSEAMAARLGQAVVVENRPGAGSVVGTAAAVQSNDGHTLLMGSTSMTVLPSLRADLPYDIQRDLQPIGMVSAQPLVLVVPAHSPLATVADLIREGRAPARALTAGTSGNGTLAHLATELFNGRAGTAITSVPYKGESALLPDLLNGTLSMGFLNLPILLPQIRAGKLRALAVSSGAPIPELPDVGTFAAAGVAGFVVEGWAALFAARTVPEEALPRLETVLREALATAPVRERLLSFGTTPVTSTRAELQAFLRSEAARWGELVRARGIRAD